MFDNEYSQNAPISNIDDLVLFDDSVNDAIELLNSLKSTTNIDHESEESIVSGVYELVYEIINAVDYLKNNYERMNIYGKSSFYYRSNKRNR